jgi:glutathione synthase/RimK-type ligase-like ATP-grasp enzyme
MTRRIGFLTAPHLPELTVDDRLVLPYLEALGIEVTPVIWTDPLPEGLDALIMRSTWAYYQMPERFEAWLASLSDLKLAVHNPPAMMLDNLHKAYLLRLAEQGWPVVPTLLLEPGQALQPALQAARAAQAWQDVILKPELSASGYETYRLRQGEAVPASLERLSATGTRLLLQPFCEAIHSEGEWSLVFMRSRFSHAVLKRPAQSHFLVQEDHGGRTEAAAPPPELLDLAQKIVNSECAEALYVRVDCVSYAGQYRLMELELLEPALYLSHEPSAPARWAQAIAESLSSSPLSASIV